MDKAIKHYFNKNILTKERLTGGYTFETWLLTLSDGEQLVFRTQKDFVTGGGRQIIIAGILERERFFYEHVNNNLGHICPEVYVVDVERLGKRRSGIVIYSSGRENRQNYVSD